MALTHCFPLAVTLVGLAAACSSSSAAPVKPVDAGGNDAPVVEDTGAEAAPAPCTDPSIPCAFVDATLGNSASSTLCPYQASMPFLSVGFAPANHPPIPQADGTQAGGHALHVSCSVVADGSGFDVSLSASTDDGTSGAALTINSSGQGSVTTGGASYVNVTWQTAGAPTAQEYDCTLAFTYMGQPLPASSLAAGRIQAHLSCPKAAFMNQASVPMTCDGEADLLFENCMH